MWGDVAIAFLLAFIVSFMATPYTIKLAHKIGAVDIPKDERRMHKKAMPKFGGPAVILGFLVSTIYLLIVMGMENTINLAGQEQYGMKLIGMFLGICIITITCVIDDIKPIKPITKLSGQLVAAIVAVAFGIRIGDVDLAFFSTSELGEVFSAVLTVLWIVGVTNAINLIDGLDGLSSGISVISAISLLVIFVLNGSPLVSIILITALAGALVGFLPFNFAPAKTFIGDRVFIGPGSKLITGTYAYNGYYSIEYIPDECRKNIYGDIVIEDDAYIGANSIIMPGSVIHEGALVGANSFVKGTLEPWTIYVGNPCKPIAKRVPPTDKMKAILEASIDWSNHL